MTSRRADALAVLLWALTAACVLTALSRLPALTSDEAWIGLYALRLKAQGLITPHEMNTYTGPLYGLLLAEVLAWRGVTEEALRLPGAVFNAAAFALLLLAVRRRAGSAAAAWGAAVLAASAYLQFKSRLAWEVYALQPLLLSATLLLLDGPATAPRALLFAALTLAGVQNHFIYLSVPASLAAMYGARVAWRGEEECRPWLRLSLGALAAGAVVFLIKPRLSEAAWPAQRAWAVPLFLALVPGTLVLGRWDRALTEALRTPFARRWGPRVAALGLLAFAVWHGVPLWLAFGDAVVWKRTLSWAAPWWLQLPLGLWSAGLLALAAWRAARAWHAHEPLEPAERTLALWPAFYAAFFILFRNTSSLRYYSPVHFLCLAALGPALARLPRPDRRWAAGAAAFAVLSAQTVFWRELAAPRDRRPLTFRIGWHAENSKDFARKDALFAALDASGACAVTRQERSFTAIPLNFHRAGHPAPSCDPAKGFEADQCPDRPEPPYFCWKTVSVPR